ncbi:MAG: response regulator, partial [Candidatus Aminicenantes bacterium]|nr:response regulator [Candidatus Aminicenantes bacterium]
YSIIKNHNGSIRVESELGRGSTFYVYLPAVGKKASKKKIDAEILPKGTGKILLMDDEEIILDATSDILQELGYTVEAVKDGSQAIKRYKQALLAGAPFDAIIMDLVVPGSKGGVETIREILKIDPEARAVVSSGYSTDPVMANFREYGFSGAVSKPYKIKDMHAALHQAIESKRKQKRKPAKRKT